jgi:hypothetical protein
VRESAHALEEELLAFNVMFPSPQSFIQFCKRESVSQGRKDVRYGRGVWEDVLDTLLIGRRLVEERPMQLI